MNLIAFLLLIPAIAAYSISQLQQHGKLRFARIDTLKGRLSFFGYSSDKRKYRGIWNGPISFTLMQPKDNWYYRTFKIAHRERWFTSTNLTVAFTDGYHMCQALFLLFLSLSITFAIGFDWLLLAGVWSGIHIIHAGVYKLLQK